MFFQRRHTDTWKNVQHHYDQGHTNQNHTEVSPHVCKKDFIKRRRNTKRWRGCREKEALVYCCVCAPLLNHVYLVVVLWTVTHQAPPSMEFPGKNTGASCHFPPQGMFPTQTLNLCLLSLLLWWWVLHH